MLSFSKDTCGYGAYLYDMDNQEFEEYMYNDFCDLLIYVDTGMEKEVLNSLLSSYPSENYMSKEYLGIWSKQYNHDALYIRVIILNAIVLCVCSLILLFVHYLNKQLSSNIIYDYSYYYLNSNLFLKGFRLFYIYELCIVCLIASIFNYVFVENGIYDNIVVIIDCLLVVFIQVILCKLVGKKNELL